MIYEVRSYRLKPRSVPPFIDAFGEAYEKRQEFSKLAAFFYTEIGPLNEVIHIWPYADTAERDKVRAEATKAGVWPPKVTDFIQDMKTEIYTPFPFVGDFGSGDMGPIFEWREYIVNPGMMPGVMKGWEEALPARREVSPLVIAMHTDAGVLNKYTHIWAYKSLEHRAQVRDEVGKKGIWPPKGSPKGGLRYQDNKICLTAPFSPLQ
ncbi:MAG: NIPSNAP family protein [Alphaproteobacteria bacterium]|jgi:hypothetical protein